MPAAAFAIADDMRAVSPRHTPSACYRSLRPRHAVGGRRRWAELGLRSRDICGSKQSMHGGRSYFAKPQGFATTAEDMEEDIGAIAPIAVDDAMPTTQHALKMLRRKAQRARAHAQEQRRRAAHAGHAATYSDDADAMPAFAACDGSYLEYDALISLSPRIAYQQQRSIGHDVESHGISSRDCPRLAVLIVSKRTTFSPSEFLLVPPTGLLGYI